MEEVIDNGIVIRNIEFTHDNLLRKGQIVFPKGISDCKGIVVFIHGLGYCTKAYEIKSDLFAKNGWALLKYNIRGHAGIKGEWTITDSVNDLMGYLDFIDKEFDFACKSNIGFFAHSTGGLIALLAYLAYKRFTFGSVTNLITSLKVSYYWWFKTGYSKEVQKYFAMKGKVDKKVKDFFEDETWFKNVEDNKISQEEYNFPYRYGLLRGNSFYKFLYEIRNSPDILGKADKIDIPIILFKSKIDEVIDNTISELFFNKLNGQEKKIIEVEPEKGTLRHFLLKSWPYIQRETVDFFNHHCSNIDVIK